MANKLNYIQFLRTSGNTAPSTSDLLEGELAVNVNASTPKIYLRTKTDIAEFGNNGDNITVGSNISYEGETLAPATSSVTQAIRTLFEYTIDSKETTAAALTDLDTRINALSGKTVINSALTLSGFTVVEGHDDGTDTVTIPSGKSAIIYNVGNEVRYKLKDVITKVTDNTASAPTGKAVGSVRVSTNSDGVETYTYTYVDYVNSAATATNATMIGGKYIETITRSEWETSTFSPQDNHVYLIYG